MDKKMRMHTTYLGLTVLLLVASVAGWASMVPGQLSVKPTVTINQAATQIDPTSTAPIHFTVVFSKVVKDFARGDVTLTGTAPGVKTVTVAGSGKIYDVAVRGMTGNGTVIANLVAGVAHDAVGNASKASTSTDNRVTYYVPDVTPPTVTINQAATQIDPTYTPHMHFTVVFNEAVTGFATGDVTLTGAPSGSTQLVTPVSGTTYDVLVNVTGPCTVIASLVAGVAQDAVGLASRASTSIDNSVTYRVATPLSVTINQAPSPQTDPTNVAPIRFRVVFSEAVTDFAVSDVKLTTGPGMAPGARVRRVTALSATTYDVDVGLMTGSGLVIANLLPGVAHNAAGNPNTAATHADNSVFYDVTAPTVTVEQAEDQDDPTDTQPIYFTVEFSEAVTGFGTGDVTLTSTGPGALHGEVSGTGRIYDVEVTGMTGPGFVEANLLAGVAQDAVGNASKASTSFDNIVEYTSDLLGTVTTFGIFGGTAGMTNQGDLTVINGDIGTTATGTSSITGFHDSNVPVPDIYTETPANIGLVNNGLIYTCTNSTTGPTCAVCIAPDTANLVSCGIATVGAEAALKAYDALVAMPVGGASPAPGANLAGRTLLPGVYSAPGGSFMIRDGLPGPEGDLTLTGTATDVWVFQMAGTLKVGGPGAAFPRSVILAGDAQAKNVYWQVGTSATINEAGGGTMVGTIIAKEAITFSTAGNTDIATLNGRALSLGAGVTMVNTHINVPLP